MMNEKNLREVVSKLEALEALAKLFNNLWFDQIRRDIKDEKVQAYLMVFEDAFPHLNHVIEFVRRSAGALSDGDTGHEQWGRLQSEFETLRQLLLGQAVESSIPDQRYATQESDEPVDLTSEDATQESDEPVADLTSEERVALQSVDQSDIDALFVDEPLDDNAAQEAAEVSSDIDALFDSGNGGVSDEESVAELEEDDEYELEDELEDELGGSGRGSRRPAGSLRRQLATIARWRGYR